MPGSNGETGRVDVELAGGIAVVAGGRRIDGSALGGALPRRTLAVLALADRALGRDELADRIWGDDLPRTWQASLRGSVAKLRRALDGIGAGHVLRSHRDVVGLDPAVEVDLHRAAADLVRAEALLASGRPDEAAIVAGRSAGVLARTLLPGDTSEVIEAERVRLGETRLRALDVQATAAAAVGDHDRVIAVASEAIGVDPYRERSHQRLIRALAARGDGAGAEAAYARCRDLLLDGIGVEPSAETRAARHGLPGTAVADGRPSLPEVLVPTGDLVGRDEVLAAVEAVWRRCRSGPGGLAVVRGESGMGKTRLVAEVATRAHAAGAAVLHGACDPDGFAAFGPLAQAFARLGVRFPDPAIGDRDRDALLAHAAAVVAQVAVDRPVLILVDDLHWADRPSVAVLDHLLGAARVDRTLVLATVRPDVRNPAVAELVGRSGATIHDLGPLDAEAVGRLIGPSDRRTLDPAEAWRASSGNPFVLGQLIDIARRDPGAVAVEGSGDAVATVASALATRLGGPTGISPIIRAAAVLGGDIDGELLAAVTDASPGATAVVLDDAVRAGLIGEVVDRPGHHRFTHALVREALLGDVGDAARADLHRRSADVISARPGHDPAAVVHALLAAGGEDDLRRALRPAEVAARRFAEAGLPEQVVSVVEPLVAGLPDVIEGGGVGVRLLGHLAAAHMALGDAQARPVLRSALRALLASGAPIVPIVPAGTINAPPTGTVDPEMVAVAEELVARTADGSPARVAALSLLASELSWTDDGRAARAAAEALDLARRLAEPVCVFTALDAWHRTHRVLAPVEQRITAGREVAALAVEIAPRRAHSAGWVYLVGDLLEAGDRAGADVAAASLRDHVADTPGDRHGRWLATTTEVMVATMEGRFGDADRSLAGVDDGGADVDGWDRSVTTATQLALLRTLAGRADEIVPAVVALAGAEAPTTLHGAAAWVLAEAGRGEEAAALVRRVAPSIERIPPDAGGPVAVAALAEAAATTGEVDHAVRLADLLTTRRGTHLTATSAVYFGAVDRVLGVVAHAAGDVVAATDLLRAAITQQDAVGARPWVERAVCHLPSS